MVASAVRILTLVCRPRRCKPRPIVSNEVPRPQPAKSLIPNDLGIPIEIRHDLVQIRASLRQTGIPEPELTDHDRQALDLRVLGLQRGHVVLDVRLQGRDGLVDVHVRALHVVVDVDHVEVAAGAGVEEGGQEVEACGAAAVGHGRGGEKRLACELVHVFLVDARGVLGAEVCLAGVVGLVGAVGGILVTAWTVPTTLDYGEGGLRKEVLASACDCGFRISNPGIAL